MQDSVNIRPIEATDNEALAKVIRDALTEFGANNKAFYHFSNPFFPYSISLEGTI